MKKYKSAVYSFDPNLGLNNDIVLSLDNWLNSWLSSGYKVDKMSEITNEGKCSGFFFIFIKEE